MSNRRTSAPGPLSIAVAAVLSEAVQARKGTPRTVTQRQLGDAIGVSQSQMSKHLRGERVLTVDQLDGICVMLELSIIEVITIADTARRRL